MKQDLAISTDLPRVDRDEKAIIDLMRSDRGPQNPALDLQDNLSRAVIFGKTVMAAGPFQDNTSMIWVCADSQQPQRVWPCCDPLHGRFGIPVGPILTISLSK